MYEEISEKNIQGKAVVPSQYLLVGNSSMETIEQCAKSGQN